MNLSKLHLAQEAIEEMQNKIYDFKELMLKKNYDAVELNNNYLISISRLSFKLSNLISQKYVKKEDEKALNMLTLFRIVSHCSGFSMRKLIKNKTQKREYVVPRQVHMALLHVTFNVSLRVSGEMYNKDHATVLHSMKTTRRLYQSNREFKYQYQPVFDFCLSCNHARTIAFLELK